MNPNCKGMLAEAVVFLIVGIAAAVKASAGCMVKKWTSDDLLRRRPMYEMC